MYVALSGYRCPPANKTAGQEPLSAYKPISKSVRTLRNKLEEVDEALGDATIRPDDIRVLYAVGESRDVLNRLDGALQHYRCTAPKQDDTSDSPTAEFLIYIDDITHKLSGAVKALDQLINNADLTLDTSIADQIQNPAFDSPSTSNASDERGRKMSMTSSLHSFSPSRASMSDKISLNSETIMVPRLEEENESVMGRPALGSQSGPGNGDKPSYSTPRSWMTPYVISDPMSIDIDQASSMILGSEASTHRDDSRDLWSGARSIDPSSTVYVDTRVYQDQRSGLALSVAGAKPHDHLLSRKQSDPKDDVNSIQQTESRFVIPALAQMEKASRSTIRIDSGISYEEVTEPAAAGISESAHKPALEKAHDVATIEDGTASGFWDAPEQQRDPWESSSLVPTLVGLTETKVNLNSVQGHASQLGNAPGLVQSEGGLDRTAPELEPDEYNHATQSKRYETGPTAVSSAPTSPLATPPLHRDSQLRARALFRASYGVKTRYRVVNPDLGDATRTSCEDSVEHLYSTPRPTSLHIPPQISRSESGQRPQGMSPLLVSRPVSGRTSPTITAGGKATLPSATGARKISTKTVLVHGGDDKIAEATHQSPPHVDEGKILAGLEQDIRSPVLQRSRTRPTRYRPPLRGAQPEATGSFDHTDPHTSPTVNDSEDVAKRITTDQAVQMQVDDPDPRWQRRSRERTDLNSTLTTTTSMASPTPGPPLANPSIGEFYRVSEIDSAAAINLDEERISSIILFWNDGLWDQAEMQLIDLLDRQVERSDLTMARRLRHLLGVIASLKGEWHQALTLFISVFNAPITEASRLDVGDCAAAYWMGDMYALLDRKAEALLAYSIAERSPLFQGSMKHQLYQCIRAEQEVCQTGRRRSDFKLHWDRETQNRDPAAADSILDTKIITSDAARSFLDHDSWQPNGGMDKRYTLDSNHSRAIALWNLGLKAGSWQEKHRLQIDKSAFTPSGPWPMMFDPFFAMANVARGRLHAHECDLLQVFSSNPAAKIPKSGPLNRSRMDCFTYQDLRWLIVTLRECMKRLEIEWSEVVDIQGPSFAAHYSSMEDRVATTHFFSITLFRLSLRPGYGVEVCSGGICSARIKRSEPNFDKGVHNKEAKRIRKLVRDYLDVAAKRQEAMNLKDTALPVMSINGVTSLHRRVSSSTKKPVSSPVSSRVSSRPGSLSSI